MQSETLNFSLPSEDKRTLALLARADGCSMAAVLRRLIRQQARKHGLLPPIGRDEVQEQAERKEVADENQNAA